MCEVCALNEVTLVVIMWQDVDDGGISERPGNMADIFHTYFGVAGLALLGHLKAVGAPYEDIDPAYARLFSIHSTPSHRSIRMSRIRTAASHKKCTLIKRSAHHIT